MPAVKTPKKPEKIPNPLPEKKPRPSPKKSRLPPENPGSIKPPAKPSTTFSEPMTSDTAKLDELAERIQKEQRIDTAKSVIDEQKQTELISQAAPAAVEFAPDPALVQISAGLVFFAMKKISNFFEKDLSPLTDQQKASLERILDKMARKYMPASFAQYQESGEVVLVLGGIVMSNLIDIRDAKPAPLPEKAPSLPETPESKVTVIHADAPPIPEGVR